MTTSDERTPAPAVLSRRTVIGAAAAVGVLSVFGPAAGSRAAIRRAGSPAFDWRPVHGRAWVAQSLPTGSNVLAVRVEGVGPVVIDTKLTPLGSGVRDDAMSSLAASLDELTLINTHHHADHVGGNWAFEGAARRIAHENAIPRIRGQVERLKAAAEGGMAVVERAGGRGGMRAAAAEAMRIVPAAAESAFVPGTAVRGDGGRIASYGDGRLDLHHFGDGHTDNDLVAHLPELNVVHTGDLVFNGVVPFISRDDGATIPGWLRSLGGIRAICDERTVVIPGHGPVGGPEVVDAQIRFFERVWAAVGRRVRAGDDRDSVLAAAYDAFDGLGFAQFRPRILGAAYDELSEIGG